MTCFTGAYTTFSTSATTLEDGHGIQFGPADTPLTFGKFLQPQAINVSLCHNESVSSLVSSTSLFYYDEYYDYTASVALPMCTSVIPGMPGGDWVQSCAPLSWDLLDCQSWTLVASCSNGVTKVISTINVSLCGQGSTIGNINGLLTW